MGESVDSDLGILELKQKLFLCKAYLEVKEFVCNFLDTTIEDRMKKEHRRKMEKYSKEIEEFRKRAEERRLERKQKLELARKEARRKTENETRIREARHREDMEARLMAEEEKKTQG
ncbi:hypothetical protein TNIN_298251 [Trichonephila inaurata madagascariensis]|uniref:Uncharacterized protein n=1 Tax=Trichonephila inaurata madagascariensis TaxID=2747483 RepID=A0A8X6Y9R6_9ARAC|nr:hypothetical protein TNIN_298251 [Trichonephila inaurata madagascariensis]